MKTPKPPTEHYIAAEPGWFKRVAYSDFDGTDRVPIVAWKIEHYTANPVTCDDDLGTYLIETPTGEFWSYDHSIATSVEAWLALRKAAADGTLEEIGADHKPSVGPEMLDLQSRRVIYPDGSIRDE